MLGTETFEERFFAFSMSSDRKTPTKQAEQDQDVADAPSEASDVDAFLQRVQAMTPATTSGARGRLIFAMDATMSRQPTWDMALGMQADMFSQVKTIGGLDVQLVYFRGFRECRTSKWVNDPEALANLMTQVSCRGGHTQIGRVLSHARQEAEREPIGAVVYVGDCMEEEIDDLAQHAGELALLKVPVFLFQEGYEHHAEVAFREIARLTHGAYCRFGPGSAGELRDLLTAVAVYAAGGQKALIDFSRGRGRSTRLLLEQLD